MHNSKESNNLTKKDLANIVLNKSDFEFCLRKNNSEVILLIKYKIKLSLVIRIKDLYFFIKFKNLQLKNIIRKSKKR